MRDGLDRWADPPLLVLASLAEEPKHGYAITQDIADTMGVRLSAGTLYAVISRLESRGLIEPLESDDRRRPYRLTAAGARELSEQSERMRQVASVAQRRLRANYGWAARERPAVAAAGTEGRYRGSSGAGPVPARVAGPLRGRGPGAA
jgi:DNA-binding PadR family transcriptional regulator